MLEITDVGNVIKHDQIYHVSGADKEDQQSTNVIKSITFISNIVSSVSSFFL